MVEDETEDELVREQAQAVLDRIKAGEEFALLAQEFGSDSTAEAGGDLGWFSAGMMVPTFEEAVFALEVGQLGDTLVRTQFGYHIVQVDDKRKNSNFGLYMQDQFEQADIDIYVPVENPFGEVEEDEE